MMPKISIISGIYNCESTLAEAINSILAQTETDWDWILCDDASCDNTYALAQQYAKQYPEKFILLHNDKNRGLNYTLNRCLEHAHGEYIARMDGDDRCSPNRFAEELAVLEENPELAIVSTDIECFDENGSWGTIRHPEIPQNEDFVHGSPFCHAPCLVRREAFEAVDGYSVEKRLLRVEDYHLWVKMYSKGYKGKNIHRSLYQMRDDRNALMRRKFRYRINEAYVRAYAIHALGLPLHNYLYVLRPILVGLLPARLYNALRRSRLTHSR